MNQLQILKALVVNCSFFVMNTVFYAKQCIMEQDASVSMIFMCLHMITILVLIIIKPKHA